MARYPATWVAIAAVLLAEWAFFALFDPPAILGIIAIVIGVVAIIAWPLTMSATGTLARLQFGIPTVDEVDPIMLGKLESDLAILDDPRPAQQLEAVTEKRDNLEAILERRLDAGELTYGRYLATTEQVYRSTVDNLHEVVVAMRSISAIDDDYISSRLAELADTDDESARRERDTLLGRRELRENQQRRIGELLAQNESGMTAIDRTATALADAPIGRTPEDAEAAMQALTELAERAGKYASD
ncbi:MAG: hypothetical protein ACR2QE_09445 [Acidimicrobiales bacterium]